MENDEVKARFGFTFSENVSKALFVLRIFILQQPSELMLCNKNGPKAKCAQTLSCPSMKKKVP